MIKKYFSKKSSDLSSIKKTFFINNNAHLKKIIIVKKEFFVKTVKINYPTISLNHLELNILSVKGVNILMENS